MTFERFMRINTQIEVKMWSREGSQSRQRHVKALRWEGAEHLGGTEEKVAKGYLRAVVMVYVSIYHVCIHACIDD